MNILGALGLFLVFLATQPADASECPLVQFLSNRNVWLEAVSGDKDAREAVSHAAVYLKMSRVVPVADRKNAPLKITVSVAEEDNTVRVTLALYDDIRVVQSGGGAAGYGGKIFESHHYWWFSEKKEALRHAAYEATRALLCTP